MSFTRRICLISITTSSIRKNSSFICNTSFSLSSSSR
nr:MAG TPA: hypothetical protein [Caudoviricetes sp.]